MNLDLQARGFTLTPALRAAVRHELDHLPAACSGGRLQVRLFDVNGLRGGIDKGCLITLHLARERRSLVVTGFDSDLYRAIPAAFDKLRRTLQAASRRTRRLQRRVGVARHTVQLQG